MTIAPLWLAILVGALGGLVAGSFMATIILRWPQGRSVMHGRSACDACGAPLRVHELVPLLSWASSGGRCRRCDARIDPLHPAIETAAALIGALAMAIQPGAGGAALALLGWQLLLTGTLDARHFWLPRVTSLLLLGTGLLFGGVAMGAIGIAAPAGQRLLSALACWALLATLGWAFRRWRKVDALGGGDPLYVAAVAAWVGPMAMPFVLLLASMAGIAVGALRSWRAPGGEARLPLGTLVASATPFALYALTRVAGAG